MRNTRLILALAAIGFTTSALATNGMNLEGYGPIATGMGGASFAYDNGTAAVMNNPATLGLGADGNRLDLAIGMLGPDVHVVGGQKSSGTSYIMPAVGWTRKKGNTTYGLAMFAQGGMGTDYGMGLDGLPERSELGVGRLIAPLAYNVSPDLTIGGSLDFVWAMLDLRMAMPLSSMMQLITVPPTGQLGAALQGLAESNPNVRIDFSDNSDFTGQAKGYGFAGKLGFTYKASPKVMIGGTYHSKTSLSDLKTGSTGASFIAAGNVAQGIPGKITVKDFQWPAIYGLGISVQASDKVMVAADIKSIGWKDVMKNFTMNFAAMGDSVTFALPQNWKDQTVLQLGVSYKATDSLTLRAGGNFANNPIPDATMNYLFPAIVKDHYTFGLGYAFSKQDDLNASLQYAPKVTQTNSTFGFTVTHSQTSGQVMYSHRF